MFPVKRLFGFVLAGMVVAAVASAAEPSSAATATPAPKAAAGVPAAVGLGPGSSLWLNGTSNVHSFEAKTSTLGLTVVRDPAAADAADAAGLATLLRSNVRGLDLDVPVTTLRSEKSGLDKNMYKALGAKDHPSIHFHLGRATVTPHAASGDTLDVSAEGQLSIAGNERPVTLVALLVPSAQGMWLEGSKLLKMTEFGVKPPTMMLGAMRVNDPVTIHYRLLLVPAGSPARATAGTTGKDR